MAVGRDAVGIGGGGGGAVTVYGLVTTACELSEPIVRTLSLQIRGRGRAGHLCKARQLQLEALGCSTTVARRFKNAGS